MAIITRLLNLPIRHKLTLIVLFTSGLLIGVMATAITVKEVIAFRHELVENMTTLSDIIGTNSTAALAFKDSATAHEILSALRAEKDVIAASLLNAKARPVATYYRSDRRPSVSLDASIPEPLLQELAALVGRKQTIRFHSDAMDLARPILLNEKIIGHMVIRMDLHRLKQSIRIFVISMIGFSLLLFVAAHLICARLNRSIVGPITGLVETMQTVSHDQDYSIRMPVRHTDEIGVLIDGFNGMLAQIQRRDDEIGRHRDRLEELVEQRTKDLRQSNQKLMAEIEERKHVQDQLAHAQKMEAIGTLAGGVAHDLNNILSGVVSYPELLLLNLPPDHPMYKPLNTIMASGKKAAAIVQDLLTLARRGVKVKESINLATLVQDYLDSPEHAKLLSFHPHATVEVVAEADLLTILGSPVHLSKTVMNLVSNAVEAMPDGGRVTISIAKASLPAPLPGFHQWRPGPYLCLSVSDTGIGIRASDIHRIFEPFYTKKVMGRSGTGLGMAVVWGTIEDHQGHISVRSQEGQGTVFEVYLPADIAVVPPKPDRPPQPLTMGTGQTILVVDDSADQRKFAEAILERLGYRPESVSSGEAAVALLSERTVDVVIIDMLMPPGMDGLDTYRAIIRIHPGQKAIIASGYSESTRVREARKLGVSCYVRKPYTLSEISDALQSTLTV